MLAAKETAERTASEEVAKAKELADEVQRVTSELQNAQCQIEMQQEDQEDTMAMLDELSAAKENLTQTKDKTELELSEKVARIHEIKERLEIQDVQIHDLTAKVANAATENENRKATISNLEATVEQLDESVKAKIVELDKAGSRLDEQNSTNYALQAQCAANATEMADLTAACTTLDENIDRLNSELDAKSKLLVESTDALESQQITLTTLEAENASAKSQLEAMAAQISSLEASSSESQAQVRPPAPCCLYPMVVVGVNGRGLIAVGVPPG